MRKRVPGTEFRSKFEASISKYLLSKGVQFTFERLTLPFVQPSKKRKYKPDFKIEETSVVIEAKGYLTARDREKLLLVREQHPNVNLVLLFMDSRKRLNKRSPTSYADWCTKHGIPFADFRSGIPDNWLHNKEKNEH